MRKENDRGNFLHDFSLGAQNGRKRGRKGKSFFLHREIPKYHNPTEPPLSKDRDKAHHLSSEAVPPSPHLTPSSSLLPHLLSRRQPHSPPHSQDQALPPPLAACSPLALSSASMPLCHLAHLSSSQGPRSHGPGSRLLQTPSTDAGLPCTLPSTLPLLQRSCVRMWPSLTPDETLTLEHESWKYFAQHPVFDCVWASQAFNKH